MDVPYEVDDQGVHFRSPEQIENFLSALNANQVALPSNPVFNLYCEIDASSLASTIQGLWVVCGGGVIANLDVPSPGFNFYVDGGEIHGVNGGFFTLNGGHIFDYTAGEVYFDERGGLVKFSETANVDVRKAPGLPTTYINESETIKLVNVGRDNTDIVYHNFSPLSLDEEDESYEDEVYEDGTSRGRSEHRS